VFGLKRGIDAGLVPGPRIWRSGAFFSRNGGHGVADLLRVDGHPLEAIQLLGDPTKKLVVTMQDGKIC
jgi:imidazolonepropionase-like amidohydrolase